MAFYRGNQSGAMTRRPLRPCDYIAYHDQQKVEALKKKMEEEAKSLEPMNSKIAPNARKRSAMEAQMENAYPPSVQYLRQQGRSSSSSSIMDPMIADTKKYLEMKRRKQAFEDFLVMKRMQKEKAKADRKVAALQKEYNQYNQKQQETAQMIAEVMKQQNSTSVTSVSNNSINPQPAPVASSSSSPA